MFTLHFFKVEFEYVFFISIDKALLLFEQLAAALLASRSSVFEGVRKVEK